MRIVLDDVADNSRTQCVVVNDNGNDQYVVIVPSEKLYDEVMNDIIEAVEVAKKNNPEEWNYSDVRDLLPQYIFLNCAALNL